MKGIHVTESPDGGLFVEATHEWPGYSMYEKVEKEHPEWSVEQWEEFWGRYMERVKAAMAKAVREYENDR